MYIQVYSEDPSQTGNRSGCGLLAPAGARQPMKSYGQDASAHFLRESGVTNAYLVNAKRTMPPPTPPALGCCCCPLGGKSGGPHAPTHSRAFPVWNAAERGLANPIEWHIATPPSLRSWPLGERGAKGRLFPRFLLFWVFCFQVDTSTPENSIPPGPFICALSRVVIGL